MVIFAVLYGQMQNLTQQNLTQLIQTLIYEKESKAVRSSQKGLKFLVLLKFAVFSSRK